MSKQLRLFIVGWDEAGKAFVHALHEQDAKAVFYASLTPENQAKLGECADCCDCSFKDLINVQEIEMKNNVSADRFDQVSLKVSSNA